MLVANSAQWAQHIFNVEEANLLWLAQQAYQHQWLHNEVYQQFCLLNGHTGHPPHHLEDFPFLPIALFKTHAVQAVSIRQVPQIVFTSSGTTGMQTSRHSVFNLALYEQSFITCFQQFYGLPAQYAFLCLLPGYLERQGSSLVYMAQALIAASGQADSGFFLNDAARLAEVLTRREHQGQKSILLGVTFALLDFAEAFPMALQHTTVMETGGMKGRKREITRAEVHELLKARLGVDAIHSEYGMTELLSQAYAKGEGRYYTPPWMRALVRAEDDPGAISTAGTGQLCIVDLANWDSCCFIETADVGRVYADGSFEVLGRLDYSDVRGCSLLAV